jgi:hypothetical protein
VDVLFHSLCKAYQPECLVFVICVKTGLFNALKIVSIPPGLFQHIHVLTNQIYSIIKSYILKPSDCKAYLFVIWLYKWFLWQKKPSFTIPLQCSPKTFLTTRHLGQWLAKVTRPNQCTLDWRYIYFPAPVLSLNCFSQYVQYIICSCSS